MNRKQREKNRKTALWLKNQQRCTRCGERGLHYVSIPTDLETLLTKGTNPGFWTCPDLYDEDGRKKEPDFVELQLFDFLGLGAFNAKI